VTLAEITYTRARSTEVAAMVAPRKASVTVSRARRALGTTFAPEMEDGERSSREPTVSVKMPCQECGGLGYIRRVKVGRVVRDRTKKCRTCGGRGLVPDDMPLSQLRELLK
jgi:hypothetical protein